MGGEDEICVLLNTKQDQKLKNVGIVREVINKIQKLRKSAGLKVDDDIIIFYAIKENAKNIANAIESERSLADQIIKKPFIDAKFLPAHAQIIKKQDFEYEEMNYAIILCHNTFFISRESLKNKFGNKSSEVENWLLGFNLCALKELIHKNGNILKACLDGKNIEVSYLEDFFLNGSELKK